MKVFTAVGIKKQDKGGRFLVSVNMEEYVLSGVEPYIWSSITWAFVDEDEVFQRMRYLMKKAQICETRSISDAEFSYGLRRLCTRGLVVAGEGENRDYAIDELLGRSIIVPFGPSAASRSTAFWLCISTGLGLRKAARALRVAQLDNSERHVLDMIRENGDIAKHIRDMTETEENEFLCTVSGMVSKRVLTIASMKGE